MRIILIAMTISVLSGSAALADPLSRPRPDYSAPPARLKPAKSASGNPCAAFGAGFVRVAGTDTCVKVGGAISVGVGGVSGPH